MKKIVFLLLLSFACASVSAQQRPVTAMQEYDRLMAKSKNQRTAGLVLTTAGAAGIAAGIVTFFVVETVEAVEPQKTFVGTTNPGIIVTGAGLVSGVGGILLLKSAKKNKMKAIDIRASSQPVSFVPNAGLPAKVPSLTLAVRF